MQLIDFFFPVKNGRCAGNTSRRYTNGGSWWWVARIVFTLSVIHLGGRGHSKGFDLLEDTVLVTTA